MLKGFGFWFFFFEINFIEFKSSNGYMIVKVKGKNVRYFKLRKCLDE